jgi:ABC-2 type transport system permease protein
MTMLRSFLLRDFRIQRSYRVQFAIQLGGTLLTLVSFAFLARLVTGGQPTLKQYGGDYFTFLLVGTGVATFFSTAMLTFSETLGREQATGTLETLLVTPNDSRVLLLGGAVWPTLISAIQLVVYFAAGAAFLGAHLALTSLALVALVLIASLLAFAGLGLLAAAVLIQTKRGIFVVGLLGSGFGILGGVMYPIAVLPGWLQTLAHGLPITYGLDAMRLSLLPSPDVLAVTRDVLVLAGYSIVLVPLAALAFSWSLDRARRSGSLSHY